MPVDPLRQQYLNDLSSVTTLTEASRLWGVSRHKLYRYCVEGKIAATKADGTGTWLLSVRCLLDMYGPPELLLAHA